MSRVVRWALVFFFLSGLTGLVYEVLWTRRLTLTFGHTVLAVSTVLTAYMAGLALGSLGGGRWADRAASRPGSSPSRFLAAYGALEAMVGAWALLSLPLLGLVEQGYLALAATGLQGPPLHLAAFVGSMLVLVPPTAAMGATLPVMSRLLVHQREDIGRLLSRLYGVNTVGAVGGAAAAGFLLLPTLGLKASLLGAAALNLGLGATAWSLGRSGRLEPAAEAPAGDAALAVEPERGTGPSAGPAWIVPLAFGLAGVASMAWQVGWTRGLVLSFGSSTYAFSAILATFLAGLGLGSLLYSRVMGSRSPRLAHLAVLQVLVGLLGGATIPLLERFPMLFLDVYPHLHDSFWGVLGVQFALSGLLLLGPTFLMGLMFPLASHLYTRDLGLLGRSVGEVYSANTFGCIAGSFLSGFVAVPLLGAQWTLKAACLVNLAVAAGLFLAAGGRARSQVGGVLLAAVAAAVVVLLPRWDPGLMSAGFAVSASRWAGAPRSEIMELMRPPAFYRDGLSSTVSVHVRNPRSVVLRVNGKTDASLATMDLQTQYLLGLIPALLHEGPRTALVIGLGSGITLQGLASVPGLQGLDCIELEPAVVEAGRYWRGYNGDVLADPRVKVHVTDGRTFVLSSPERYDLLVSEPSNPWIAGIGNLFTRDFYARCRERLAPGGIMAQWVQLYSLSDREIGLVLRSFYQEFPQGLVWQTSVSDMVLLGGREPLAFDAARARRAWEASPRLREIFDRLGLSDPDQLAGHFLLTREEALRLFPGEALNTDDRPLLEFSAPLNLYRRNPENVALARAVATLALPPGVPATPRQVALAAVAWVNVGRTAALKEMLSRRRDLPDRAVLVGRLALSVAPGEADLALRKALERRPQDPVANALYARLLLEGGRWAEAVRHYEVALRHPLPGAGGRLRTGAGIALRQSGHPLEAVVLLEQGADETLDSWPVTELGLTWLALQRPEQALAAFQEAGRRNPCDVDAFMGEGTILLAKGDGEAAAAAFRQAVSLIPDYVEAWVRLGQAEGLAGRPRDARRAFRRALGLDPGQAEARKALASPAAR